MVQDTFLEGKADQNLGRVDFPSEDVAPRTLHCTYP